MENRTEIKRKKHQKVTMTKEQWEHMVHLFTTLEDNRTANIAEIMGLDRGYVDRKLDIYLAGKKNFRK